MSLDLLEIKEQADMLAEETFEELFNESFQFLNFTSAE